MSEPKLKACPFCGETPDVDDPRTFVASQGTKWGAVVCCITGPEVRTDYKGVEHWRDKAISAWNRRATVDTDSREAVKRGDEGVTTVPTEDYERTVSACAAALALVTGTGQDGTLGHHPDNPVPTLLRAALAALENKQ